ncbi:hypothetical protein MAR_011550 [Mya arenaria]|uniref:ADP-ribosylglycohydrolase family protein n=1 Tax=Mya arenaria TaxID=6604 RepID=A0ABY7FYE1_MYAAR|nr:hypothetical protein MAR_011550 [Mya arenaria]
MEYSGKVKLVPINRPRKHPYRVSRVLRREVHRTYDKIYATIYGQCVGDALGLLTEGLTKEEIKRVDPVEFARRLMYWSDQGLPELGDEGNAGMDSQVKAVVTHPQFSEEPLKWQGQPYWGCINMRPWGRCEASCVAVSAAIAMLIQKSPQHMKKSGKYDIEGIIDDCFVYASRLLSTDQQVKELKAYMYPPGLKEMRLDDPAKASYTYKAVGAGFWALRQKDFRQAIQAIVLEGGDADANAAVAGALLGCKLGLDAIPRSWMEPLKHRAWLDELIDRYFDIIERKKREKETVV